MRFKTLFLALLHCFSLHARPGYFTPWGKDADLSLAVEQTEPSKASLLSRGAKLIISFHQKVLSPVDGPRSHFIPCSSNYMLNAIEKYGFFQGFIMGCDRLLRENSDDWCYKTIEKEGKLFKYNPVP